MESPPWEWVRGDAKADRRASLYFALAHTAPVASSAFPLIWAVGLVQLQFPPASFLLSLLVPFVGIPIGVWIPRHLYRSRPLVSSLGISPLGLRFRLVPFNAKQEQKVVDWYRVLRVGDSWIEVTGLRESLLRERYRLTPNQTRRLNQFLGAAPLSN